MKRILCVAVMAAIVHPPAAVAGPIDRACMASPREARSSRLCTCIQRVADRTLSQSDQRLAAKFFKDPQMAQDIRQSDNRSHEAFWEKYKIFGATAEETCR